MANQTLLNLAVELAEAAGRNTLAYFGVGKRDPHVEYKADDSPVTEADRSSELLMREQIRKHFPDHGILGEEFDSVEGKPGAPTWILDPIDGTRAFVAGVPLYTVLVALVDGDTPRIGVIHNPVTRETVWAERGEGCFFNGTRVGPTEARHPSSSEGTTPTVCCTDYGDLARRHPALLSHVAEAGYTSRTWADAYGYLLLATGRVDGMIDPVMSAWDIAPMYPIVEEAGGIISSLSGNREPLGTSALAATPALHPTLLRAARS
jgi:histidinol-phosphatase